MRLPLRALTMLLLAAALASCAIVYHPPLQQGNLLSKKTVDDLKPGMTKTQVVALMGTPSITSPFDHDRWDYVHAFAINGGKMQVRRLSLFFNNDTLVRTQGSLFAPDNAQMLQQAKMYNKSGVDNNKGDKSSGDDGGDNGNGG